MGTLNDFGGLGAARVTPSCPVTGLGVMGHGDSVPRQKEPDKVRHMGL